MTESAAIWEDIDALVPWGDNPRINDHAVENVANSIKRFGFASPIVARLADKMVIAGHTRLKAARSLGLDKVPVRYLDIDPADAKMLALADNKIGELSAWDNDALSQLLQDLKDQGEDLGVTSFSSHELEALLGESEDFIAKESEEIDVGAFNDFNHMCPRCGFEWDE
jgi:site-specific DNA-methyltransferase (adenine-specific)